MADSAGGIVDPAALPLRDIHLPPPVSWWPPAPGWWLLLGLLLLLAVGVVWMARRRRRSRLRTEARQALKALRADWRRQSDALRLARELSLLLRRIGISLLGRNGFSGLTGREEIDALNRLVDDDHRLPPELGDWLRTAPYRPRADEDAQRLEAWLDTVEHWIDALPKQSGGAS